MGAPAAGRLLGCLLLLACLSAAPAEPRSRAPRIKVNPRGNLWATGHFMGKKSIAASPLLESRGDAAPGAAPVPFGPTLRAAWGHLEELLARELLSLLAQERRLDAGRGRADLRSQELGSVRKALEKYLTS